MGTFSRQRVAELAAKAGVTEQDMADELAARKHTIEPVAQMPAEPDTLPVEPAEPMPDEGGGFPWGPAAIGGGILATGAALTRVPAVVGQMSREPGFAGAIARGTRAFFGREPRAPGAAPPGDVQYQQQATARPAPMPEEFEAPQRGSVESRMAEARAEKLEQDARRSRALADAAEAKRDRDAAGRFKPEKGQAKSRLAEPSESNIRSLAKARGEPEPAAKAAGSAESRVPRTKTIGQGQVDKTPGSRHEIEYASASQKKFIPIETMTEPHIRNALNQMQGEISAGRGTGEVFRKQRRALLDELTYRMKQTGGELTVLGTQGEKQAAKAGKFEAAALKRAFPKVWKKYVGSGTLSGKARGALAALPLILSLPEIARAEERDRKAGVSKEERVERIIDQIVGKLAAAASPIGLDETAGKESEAPDIVEREFTR